MKTRSPGEISLSLSLECQSALFVLVVQRHEDIQRIQSHMISLKSEPSLNNGTLRESNTVPTRRSDVMISSAV